MLDQETLARIKALNETTAVVEVHYATRRRIDTRQIVFPVGDRYTSRGIFFTSNISSALCPAGEHQMISGTPGRRKDPPAAPARPGRSPG